MRWIAALMLLSIGLTGCGHSSPRHTAQTGTGALHGHLSGPQGHLSPAEYKAIVREYRELRPLQQSQADAASLAQGRQACARLRSPDTLLVVLVRQDCHTAIAFFQTYQALGDAGAGCTNSSQRDRLLCARNRYSRMAGAIRQTTQGGIALNAELRRRGIGGLCAASIGMTSGQVASYRSAEQAARDAVDAISVGDPLGFEQASNQLTVALDAGSAGDPLAGIVSGCKPPAARPQPKRTPGQQPPTTPQPRPAPGKPLPQIPDNGGINA